MIQLLLVMNFRYKYYLVDQISRLINYTLNNNAFSDNSVEVGNKKEGNSGNNSRGVINEYGMQKINEPAKKAVVNQQTEYGSNATNDKPLTHISNYNITFIQDLKGGETEEEAETPCCSCMPPMFDKMYNKLNHWFKGKEGNVESELEVPLLDKSGENNETKYSNGNNSSGGIIQNIFNRFAPKSDKSKSRNMSVASQKEEKKQEVLEEGSLKNTRNTESEVSTEANTARDNGSENRDDLMDAPKKGVNVTKDDRSTEFKKGEESDALDLGEITISLQKLFENMYIDDL